MTGRWRDFDRDANAPIDASTALPGGGAAGGPVDLTAALLDRPDQFVQAMTEKLMMYALGRELEYFDMPEVRAVVRAASRDHYRFASIVTAIVNSDAFRLQALPHAETTEVTARARTGAGFTVSVPPSETDLAQVARTETVNPAPSRE